MHWNKRTVLFLLTALLCVLLCGCGVNRKTPKGVVKSLLTAYEKGKEKNALACYGMKPKDADADTKADVQASIAYFAAHEAGKVAVEDCGEIAVFDGYTYLYARYSFVVDKNKKYPAIGTYLVAKKDKKYCIVPANEINETVQQKVQQEYQKFMKTEPYLEYTKRYDAFLTKYHGYEDKIAARFESGGAGDKQK